MSRVCSNMDENAAEMDELIDQEIEIKGDQLNEENQADAALLNLNYTDLWALGLTTAIGGHFFAWTSALSTGFGTYIVSLTVLSTAYFILMMCISELSSALPFAGGVYGLARVTLGIYPGYLVAVNDTIKSILATSTAAYYVGAIIATATDTNEEMYYLYWALFYIYCLAVNVFGGRTFWRINKASALISVVFLIIYIFGVIRYVDFNENVPLRGEEGDDRWFKGGMYAYMQNIGGTARFYTGIQSINLACGQMKRPKTDVPKAYLGIMTTLVCTSFVLSFLASAMPPGVNRIMKLSFPLTPGFAKIFDILPKKAVLLTLPPSFFYGSTYLYYCGQQMSAMSRSGLLNALFGKELPVRKTPVYSLLAGTIISYIVCVLRYHYAHVREQLFSVMVLVTMSTYIAILVSFILFRNYFPSIKRDFESPFGSAGAVYALIFFCLQLVSVAGFQKDQIAIIVFAVLLIVVSIYYYFVVRHRQVFSEEEKTVMFTAYLVKSNQAKASRMKKGLPSRPSLINTNNTHNTNNTKNTSSTTKLTPLSLKRALSGRNFEGDSSPTNSVEGNGMNRQQRSETHPPDPMDQEVDGHTAKFGVVITSDRKNTSPTGVGLEMVGPE